MILKRFLPIVIIIIFFTACKKNNASNNSIDVSTQWHFDISGNILSGYPDSQWRAVTFTAKELALFQSLDTVNLVGTTKPPSVNIEFYPNPFATQLYGAVSYPNSYKGTCILKCIIVDNSMNPLTTSLFEVKNTNTTMVSQSSLTASLFVIHPAISAGEYRIYYTLSAEGNENFYEGWGNIQKTN